MGWFTRLKEGISTATKLKKETPDGLWYKCPECNTTSTTMKVGENFYKCPSCNYHTRISSDQYFNILFGDNYETVFDDLESYDFL